MGDNRVLKAQKTTFSNRHGLCNILFLSLGELGIYLQNLISTRGCGTLRKKSFSTRGYAEIQIQRLFFDNNKGIQNFVVLRFQMVSTCFGASSTCKKLKSQVLVVFQSSSS
jgi:hypothetical protein